MDVFHTRHNKKRNAHNAVGVFPSTVKPQMVVFEVCRGPFKGHYMLCQQMVEMMLDGLRKGVVQHGTCWAPQLCLKWAWNAHMLACGGDCPSEGLF